MSLGGDIAIGEVIVALIAQLAVSLTRQTMTMTKGRRIFFINKDLRTYDQSKSYTSTSPTPVVLFTPRTIAV